MADRPRRRAPRGSGEQLRGQILQVAMALLAETGDEERMNLREVARRAGVSVPAIYLHFADKQALLDAVCAEVFAALFARLRAAAADAPHAFEGLRRQGKAYVQFALENPEHYRVVMMRRHDPAAGADAPDRAMASDAFAYLVESVRQCVADEVLTGDPVQLALQLWAAAHGVAALLVAKPYFPWPPQDDFVDRTISMAGLGLLFGNDPAGPAPVSAWRRLAATARRERRKALPAEGD